MGPSRYPTNHNPTTPIMTITAKQQRYPAKAHARRVAEILGFKEGVVHVNGQVSQQYVGTDSEVPFRQDRTFFYLSGCDMAGCAVTYDIGASVLVLYIPPVDPAQVLWSGMPPSLDECSQQYDVDDVRYFYKLDDDLNSTKYAKPRILLADVTSATNQARTVKDKYEIGMIERANEISTAAHTALLQAVKMAENEMELQGLFEGTCIARSGKQAYHPIVAGGRAASTLHYNKNNQPTKGKQLMLVDAAAEFNCYCADVTRTFPISGKFTPEAKEIYDLVYGMQQSCFDMIKPGVSMVDVHLNAHKVAIRGLMKLGVLVDGSEDEIYESGASTAFFPHGLGHALGLETHDVTVATTAAHVQDRKLEYLRLKNNLEEGMVVTVEPGVYFNEFILKAASEAKYAKYINFDAAHRYMDVGGVRIEDDVVVTGDGHYNLTRAPKETEEIERLVL